MSLLKAPSYDIKGKAEKSRRGPENAEKAASSIFLSLTSFIVTGRGLP